MKQRSILLLAMFLANSTLAQEDTNSPPLVFSGYLETYYLFDFNKPINNTLPPSVYSFNRHNEFNLNLGFIKGSYINDKVRANLALMVGTYANANLAAEPGVLRNIYEANAGVRLSANKNLWLDAGIFSSHIGFESAIGKDCWNLTRSILADNSPYYEAGAKISYETDNGKWFLSGLVLNGWQRIQRVNGNSLPSFGTQITFKPSSSVTINSSTFIGTDKPDSARLMRYYHNFYGIIQVSKKIGITVGFDYGTEEKPNAESGRNVWFSPVLMIRASLNDKITLAARGEYYDDEYGVVIATGTPNGYKTTGISLNLDYKINSAAVWRIEARNFTSKDEIYTRDGQAVKNESFVSTSLAISF